MTWWKRGKSKLVRSLSLDFVCQLVDPKRNHFLKHGFEGIFRTPLGRLPKLSAVAPQARDFLRPKQSFVKTNKTFPIQLERSKNILDDVLDAMGYAGGTNKIVCRRLLQNHPHRANVVFGMSPIAFRRQIA